MPTEDSEQRRVESEALIQGIERLWEAKQHQGQGSVSMKIYVIKVGRETRLFTSEAPPEAVQAAGKWFMSNCPFVFSSTHEPFTVEQWWKLARWMTSLGIEGWEEGEADKDDPYGERKLEVWEEYHVAEAVQAVIALKTGYPFEAYAPTEVAWYDFYYDSSYE